ncbi:PLP-dependent aminotransferase family protein [Streptomyces sp. NPDC007856]|uniref:aminotransferase-like domain-containing protein n=1 Tax=Streptomyces sp. NPDC007856 TaxID=3364781 RepID=UPI00368F80A9
MSGTRHVNSAEPGARIDAASALAASLGEILAHTSRPGVISFAGGMPAPDLFDAQGISAAYAKVLATPQRTLQYSTTEGDPQLRAVLAERISRQGLATEADALLITTGAQQALSLACAALLAQGDTVLVEEPTYLVALQCFTLAGARVVAVGCDGDGVEPSALEEAVRLHRPRLVYLAPTFHNPTGRTMPVGRRRAVASLAARYGFWIAEDDPYRELRYEGGAEPWIASLPEAADRTVLLGSLSKSVAPGLRLGWLRAPAALRRACVTVKGATDVHSSTIDQAAAAAYLTDGDLDGHLKLVRSAYQERRDALLDGLAQCLPPGSQYVRPCGGMFVWARLPAGYDATALLGRAVDQGVAFVPGEPFFSGSPDRRTLRLSFPTHRPSEIEEGLRRLRRAFAQESM